MSSCGGRGRGASGATTTNGHTVNQTQVDTTEVIRAPTQPNFAMVCKNYTTLGGKIFRGIESLVGVQAWIRSCEKIFKGLRLDDEHKRLLASWNLEGAAAIWWDAQTANTPEENFTWPMFKEAFEGQYLPATGRTRMYRDFVDLKQESMSVAEYENQFNALSIFGPELINTLLKKNEMFVAGLRDNMQGRMMGHLKDPFVELVDLELRYEALDTKKPGARIQTGETSGGNAMKRKVNPDWNDNQGQAKTGQQTVEGKFKNVVCHNCKKKGHIARFCKQKGNQKPQQYPRQQQKPQQ